MWPSVLSRWLLARARRIKNTPLWFLLDPAGVRPVVCTVPRDTRRPCDGGVRAELFVDAVSGYTAPAATASGSPRLKSTDSRRGAGRSRSAASDVDSHGLAVAPCAARTDASRKQKHRCRWMQLRYAKRRIMQLYTAFDEAPSPPLDHVAGKVRSSLFWFGLHLSYQL